MIIQTSKKREIIDLTDSIQPQLHGNGVILIFVQHTTAAVTTSDLDPGTDEDYLRALELMTPTVSWHHPHDPQHFPDHLWATVIGPSVSIPYKNGSLQLGTWQRIILMEFDGPKQRSIEIVTYTI